MGTKIDVLIAKMEQSRAILNAAVENLDSHMQIYPAWQVKQLLDHITGWDELVLAELRAYQSGITPTQTIKSINEFNAHSVAARQDLTLEQSRKDYDSTRQEVLQTMRALPAELVTRKYDAPWGGKCTVASIVKIFVSHEREHAEAIEKIVNDSTNESKRSV